MKCMLLICIRCGYKVQIQVFEPGEPQPRNAAPVVHKCRNPEGCTGEGAEVQLVNC